MKLYNGYYHGIIIYILQVMVIIGLYLFYKHKKNYKVIFEKALEFFSGYKYIQSSVKNV